MLLAVFLGVPKRSGLFSWHINFTNGLCYVPLVNCLFTTLTGSDLKNTVKSNLSNAVASVAQSASAFGC